MNGPRAGAMGAGPAPILGSLICMSLPDWLSAARPAAAPRSRRCRFTFTAGRERPREPGKWDPLTRTQCHSLAAPHPAALPPRVCTVPEAGTPVNPDRPGRPSAHIYLRAARVKSRSDVVLSDMVQHRLGGVGEWLGSVTLEVFSSRNGSSTL